MRVDREGNTMINKTVGSQSVIKMAYGYGIVSRTLMTDPRIDIKAKAIYALLCSYAGTEETAFPSVDTIRRNLIISKDTYYKHMKQLKETGYIVVNSMPSEAGKFSKNIYTIVPCPNSSDTENPYTEKPYAANQDTNNNNTTINNTKNNNTKDMSSENDIKEVFNFFITSFKKNPKTYKLSDARRAKIKSRLKEKDAGKEMLMLAIEKTSKSPFHNGGNNSKWKADIDFIIRSYEQVERLANMEIAGQFKYDNKPKVKIPKPMAEKPRIELTPEAQEKNKIVIDLMRNKRISVSEMNTYRAKPLEELRTLI